MGRIASFDGLRGVAALAVLIAHGGLGITPTSYSEKLLRAITDSGWIGVDLFFALSGFLITNILIESSESPHYFRIFYLRRAARIFAIYYLIILSIFFLYPVFHPPVASGWPWYVFYASNLYSGFMGVQPVCPAPFVLFHTWSLAIEEQFYAVWPAIVRLLNPRRLVVLCLALAVCANVSRFGFADQLNPRAAWCLTWCRLDGLALGSVAAVITRSEIERERLRFLAVVGFAVSAVGLTGLFLARHGLRDTDIWTLRVGLMMTPLFSTALVLSAAAGGFAANLFSVNILRFFGRYSYGMYLWQILPSDGLARKYFLIVPRTGFLEISFIPAYIALLTFVAIVSYHLYERPFLLLKERFRSGASRSLATSSLGSDDPADQDARPLSGGLVP